MSKKIVFLYTEIAEYFVSCTRYLAQKGVEVHVVRYPVNKEAPFKFQSTDNIFFHQRSNFTENSLRAFLSDIHPDVVVVSGWKDKTYLKAIKRFRKTIPVVLSLDNHWKATPKQYLAIILSRFTLLRIFSHAWVPGNRQKEYAQRLGFRNKNIRLGFYSADTDLYSAFYEKFKTEKRAHFPRNFIFVGRYIKQKGIFDLWDAFVELQDEMPSDWNLICLGTGGCYDQRIIHPKIKHLGFVQASEMETIVQESGVFVLPSLFEPWGVVVHEFASAGFPLICSDATGAADTFIQHGENGFLFKTGNKNDLKLKMKTIMSLSDKQLLEMSEKSVQLAGCITPAIWSETIINLINQ